jgi:hypothetical protein
MLKLRLMSLVGPFAPVGEVRCADLKEALAAVKEHASRAGYTNVKIADDGADDGDGSYRFTARTPGGRPGRNVAFAEDDFAEDDAALVDAAVDVYWSGIEAAERKAGVQ